MALARHIGHRDRQNLIWPGFVDGLATLLMVIIFVLMVFFLIQTNLAQRVLGQDETMRQLQVQISDLANLLNIEREASSKFALERQHLIRDLEASQAQITGLETQITSLDALILRIEESEQTLLVENQGLKTDLTTLEDKVDTLLAENDAAQRDLSASHSEVVQLTVSLVSLREKLGELQALLDEKTSEAREAKEVSVNLTKQLNEALSSKVAELTRFRSEFFGRLREVLKDRSDITIVGDRFVLQSEVLFALGSAEIGEQGKIRLDHLSIALRDIAATIPDDIDWILQIDGHTDNLPIRTGLYRDNWDLSTARAVAVTRYLIERGVNPRRLAATGYGEYQPIDRNETPHARARNRRIEFKLTRRVAKTAR